MACMDLIRWDMDICTWPSIHGPIILYRVSQKECRVLNLGQVKSAIWISENESIEVKIQNDCIRKKDDNLLNISHISNISIKLPMV